MKHSSLSRRQVLTLGTAAALGSTSSVWAQSGYPNKPIRMIIPLAAGSAVDVAARLLAQKMSASLGQSVVIENITGAAGIIGADKLAKSPADGYTIGGFNDSILTMVPNINPNTPFNPLTDFSYITLAAAIEFSASVAVNSRFKNIGELVAAAKAAPDTITYASGGIGSPQHIAGALLSAHTGVKLKHVPYKGASQAAQGAAAGEVDVTFQGIATVAALVKAGKLRAIGFIGDKRSRELPDVPTFTEQGFGDAQVMSWYTIAVRAGTPPEIVNRIHDAAMKVVAGAETRERLDKASCDVPDARTPAEVQALYVADYARYGKLVKEAGIKSDS